MDMTKMATGSTMVPETPSTAVPGSALESPMGGTIGTTRMGASPKGAGKMKGVDTAKYVNAEEATTDKKSPLSQGLKGAFQFWAKQQDWSSCDGGVPQIFQQAGKRDGEAAGAVFAIDWANSAANTQGPLAGMPVEFVRACDLKCRREKH